MAKITGVGKERIISGNKYFPIYYRFNGHMVINSSVKAETKIDAYRQLEAKIKEFHSKPQITAGVAANLERRRVEALRLRFAPMPDGVEHAEAGAATRS